MKHFFLPLLLVIATSGFAQQLFDRHKMSDYLCSLITTPSSHQVKGVKYKESAVTVLMKLNYEGGIQSVAEEYGCQILDSIGTIYIVRAPLARLGQLSLDNRVLRIDAHEMPRPTMNEVPTRIGADKVWQGVSPLPQAFTGEGVIAGVVDIGFDFTHPMFQDSNGNSRVIDFLEPVIDDQGELVWNHYDSQEVYDLQKSSYAPYQYHGTHVASIMAGSAVEGIKGTYSGIAPESDIIIVEFGTDSVGILKSTTADLILYFKQIFDQADALKKPCTVNLSAGAFIPFPVTLEDEALNSLLGPGKIIIAASGNDGNEYYGPHISKGEKENDLYAQFYGVDDLSYYSGANSRYLQTNSINCYLMTKYPQTLQFHQGTFKYDRNTGKNKWNEFTSLTISTDSLDALNGEKYIIEDSIINARMTITASTMDIIYDERSFYQFSIVFSGLEWFELPLSCYLYYFPILVSIHSDYPCDMFTNPNYAPFMNVELGMTTKACSPLQTVSWPASVDGVIAVGAMNKNVLASFSSQGPSWSNQIKPNVVAPGCSVHAAYDHFYESGKSYYDTITDNNSNGHYIITESGTSMSSPVVAGAITLWLQAKPDLTPAEIKEVLAMTCSHPDSTEVYPNNRYGYGEIDVYRGLLYILGLPDKIENLSAHQPSSLRFQLHGRRLTVFHADTSIPLTEPAILTVYATDGRQMASITAHTIDLSHLPSGIYAVQVSTGSKETTGSTLIRL